MKRTRPAAPPVVLGCLVLMMFGGQLGAETVHIKVAADSAAPGYRAANAFDGDPATLWHTPWGPAQTPLPHELIVDLGNAYPLTGLVYTPRSDGWNGTIRTYACYVSNDPSSWGAPVAEGGMPKTTQPTRVLFPRSTAGRYVRLVCLSEVNGRPWASAAEIDLLSPGRVFRAKARTDARRHEAPVVRKRQGPDTSTLEGALEMARLTLELVQRAAERPDLATRLAALRREAETCAEAETEALRRRVCGLRRRIIFSHPALAFDRLLINKRPTPTYKHQVDQYLGRHNGPGDGLVVLDDWKGTPKATVLLDGRLPPGTVLHPDLSFDGKRILFSYCDQTIEDPALRRFFIYEVGIDGKGLRQITGTRRDPMTTIDGRRTVLVEDWDPCYLPGGGFAFVSTRNQGGVRCHHGGRYCPTFVLYRSTADGSSIVPLSYGEANEWDPSVRHDGSIVWTRWDYINRHDTLYQSLWTSRPDGTGTAHFYGNYTRNPCSIAEARAIPGTNKVVATATAHHHYTGGSIVIVDPERGRDGAEPITRVTPEASFPETEGWPTRGYATPWPLTEEIFLVARADTFRDAPRNAYAIYLVDTLGGRELIYRDPNTSCFCPIPLRPRPRPPILPSLRGEDPRAGTVYIKNVYDSSQPIPEGSVKGLRVVRVFPQTTQRVPDRSQVLFEVSKGVVGATPVREDGSVSFTAPAGVPLLFQLLDESGSAVMGMRSFVYLQPGERLSCTGCHEPRQATPARGVVPVPPPVALTPLDASSPPRPLSFAETVQPVLDRYCIECHGLGRKDGGISLLGTLSSQPLKLGRVRASEAYSALTARKGWVTVAHRNRETPFSRPGDYGSRAGRLAGLLLHGDANHDPLPPVAFRRVARWLDLNAPFYGGYSWNKAEWRLPDAKGEQALRDYVRQCLGDNVAGQPFAALVNLAYPEQSRILLAPLAESAGGWGQLGGPAWADRQAPGVRRMEQLVRASILPAKTKDRSGTCQQKPCQCRACWVPEAEMAYRANLDARGAGE